MKAATSAASKRASKKPIVTEMEYAYYDEVKPQYKDPIVEGAFVKSQLGLSSSRKTDLIPS